MVKIGSIKDPRYAQAFADYLQTLGIAVEQQVGQEGVEFFLTSDEHLQRARQELLQFIEAPNSPRYRQASWEISGDADSRSNAKRLSGLYRSNSFQRAFAATGLVNKIVIGLCTLVFLITAQGESFAGRPPFFFFSSTTQMTDLTQVWRWMAPAFVHFGWIHFLFNMSAWWIFGTIVERMHSSARLLWLLVLCGITANAAQFFWSGFNFGGLSGVVYGVVAYLWFYGRFHPESGIRLPTGLYVFMIITLALGFTNLFPFANQAHLAGFVMGCVLGVWFAVRDKAQERLS